MTWIIILLIVIIVLMVAVQFFNYIKKISALNSDNYLGVTGGLNSVKYDTLSNPGANIYSFEIWVYVNGIDGASTSSTSYGSSSNAKGNLFQINTDILSLDILKDSSVYLVMNNGAFSQKVVDNLPMRRWEYFIINVNNGFVEVYLDGKLMKSVQFNQAINKPNQFSTITFGTGDIYIYSFNRYLYNIDSVAAYNMYLNGNTLTMSPNFNINIDLVKNNNLAYSYPVL